MIGLRAAGLASSLVGVSVRTSVGVSRVGIVTSARVARSLSSAPVSVVRSVAGPVLDSVVARRQVWSAHGRAQIEVRGLQGRHRVSLIAAVPAAVDSLSGVAWCRLDVVTHRMVVRFDPGRVTVDQLVAAVERAEQAVGAQPAVGGPMANSSPGDSAPVRAQAWGLAAELIGLSTAVVGRVGRLPSLPATATAAVVLVDYQPRLRRALDRRIGAARTDLALAMANATVHGLTQGVPALIVDSGLRAQGFMAARARRDGFGERESDLCGPQRPASVDVAAIDRPVPLPAGPVERLADRAAAGSLLTAGGLWALTGSVNTAGKAVLVAAPKAARAAREAFATTLTVGLTRRGLVVVDEAALRRLDRVTTVVVDSSVLLGERPLIVHAEAVADGWSQEHVWSAGQRLLADEPQLPVPPPPGRRRHRLRLVGTSTPAAGELSRLVLTEDGAAVGELLVGGELDAYADAVLSAAQDAGLRLVVTANPSAPELAGRADQVLPSMESRSQTAFGPEDLSPGHDLADDVRRLQADGHIVAVISAAEAALAAADVGIAVVPAAGRVPWTADLLCGPSLQEVPRLLAAVPVARAVSERGVTLSVGASFLGGLLTVVRSGRRGGATLPVNLAAGSALVSGTLAARRVLAEPDPQPVPHTPWHALEPDEVVQRLSSVIRPPASELPPEPRTAPLNRLIETLGLPVTGATRLLNSVRAELADPLTPVLATGAAASAVIGSPTDALLVGSVLAANAVISGVQRLRAEQALHSLFMAQRLTARLVNPDDHAVRVVSTDGLAPGDVIELEPGDVVPADARLLHQVGLEVDEASLTGESVAVPKQVEATPGAELADRACLVYEGTTVLAGSGRAVVVAVGAATEAGRALRLAGRSRAPAGMQARLEELTRRGLPITLLGGAAVTGLGLLRGQPIRRAISSGVSVAVAAVPEGLPLVATVAQLSAARRLSQQGVLVRSPRTLEALGRVDTVCFDKTGTLTEGRLRLVRAAGLSGDWALTAPEAVRVLRAAARACPQPGPDQPLPHATDQAVLDGALVALGDRIDGDWEELSEVPFQSERGYSAAVGRTGPWIRLVVKGAPEVLLPRCTHVRDEHGKRRLGRSGREQAEQMIQTLAGQGLRVLAVARRTMPLTDDSAANGLLGRTDEPELAAVAPATASHDEQPTSELEDLTLLGFVALADAARPEAAPTVAGLQAAGLTPVMITGDHPVTARAIASSLGISAERVVTGPQLAAVDDDARTKLVAEASVFARVSPEQKLRIIGALQKAGRVVAMTGDGANDAAAIRVADVGIGMAAHGSTSARTAADLVFTKPDLSLLLDALVEGRAMWRRVRDAVAILLGGNAGEVAFTLVGTGLAGRAPIGTRQFLLVNMLTDLMPAMAIALAATPTDPAERREVLMAGRPSLGAPLLRDIGVRGATTAAGALTAWQVARVTGRRRRADTVALAALVGTQLGQTLVVGGRNPLVIGTGVGSALVLAAIIQTPGVSQFFGCTPLGPVGWATAAGCAGGATALAVLAPRLMPRPGVVTAAEDASDNGQTPPPPAAESSREVVPAAVGGHTGR